MNDTVPVVTYEAAAGVARIRLNRPHQLNALNAAMAAQLADAVNRAIDDADLRVIVLAGEGRAFMAGGDLAVFRAAADKPRVAHDLIGRVHGALQRLDAAPQIVVASLHGAVAGAGMSLALFADLAIAADDATFNLAYARIGASPDCGATWTLPRLVGLRRAMEIALLSETIGAAEALRLGLVNRVVPASELAVETERLASRLAAGPAVAQAHIKRLLRDSLARTLPQQLDAEGDAFAACAGTQDFAEAIDAFFAKRSPRFRGC